MQQEKGAMTTNLRGILAPALTAVTDNFQIHVERTIAHFEWLLESGCDGLLVFGTTSEANSFSVLERRRLLEKAVDAGINPRKLLIGTGCCALSDSIELTTHALQIGCAGVLTLPPYYYKQVEEAALFRYFASLIHGVSDDRLRLYLYHIPPIAIVGFTFSLIEQLIAAFPTVIAGIKDSSGDWNHTKELIARFSARDLDIFAGDESCLLAAVRAGGAGSISGAANVSAASLQAIYRQGADADARQAAIGKARRVFLQFALIPALKAIIATKRCDEAWFNVRPPLLPLDERRVKELFAQLDAAGFEWPEPGR
jgi:4-hydroxy-tetrahydrodipicolinate synthase